MIFPRLGNRRGCPPFLPYSKRRRKFSGAVCYKVRTVSELHRFNAFEVFLVVEVVVDAAEHLAGIAHGVVNLIGFFKVACRFLQNGVDFG